MVCGARRTESRSAEVIFCESCPSTVTRASFSGWESVTSRTSVGSKIKGREAKLCGEIGKAVIKAILGLIIGPPKERE